MKRVRWLVVAAMAASTFFACVAQASAYAWPYYGYHAVAAVGSEWTGVRVNMEVRAGDISATDAAAGRYIAQQLFINNALYSDGQYVTAGVIRRNNSQSDEVTQFFWQNCNGSGEHWHYVQRDYLDPADYVGTQQTVAIINFPDTNNWAVVIAGQYAQDNSGDFIANTGYDSVDNYFIGLQFTAASGKYGTNGNPSNNAGLQRSLDYGATWGNPSASYALDGFQNDPAGWTHLGWTTRPTSSWIYRNSN